MDTMQKQFEKQVGIAAGNYGLTPVQDADYGNRGRIYFQAEDGNFYLGIDYDFQPGSASLKSLIPGKDGPGPVKGIHVRYARDPQAGTKVLDFPMDAAEAAFNLAPIAGSIFNRADGYTYWKRRGFWYSCPTMADGTLDRENTGMVCSYDIEPEDMSRLLNALDGALATEDDQINWTPPDYLDDSDLSPAGPVG